MAMVLVAIAALASASAFSRNLQVIEQAKTTTTATLFLDTVLEDLHAQNYDSLLALNGNRIFDQATEASSQFSADLTVTQIAVDLIQVRAVLEDLQRGREIARVSTLRSRR